MYGKDYDKITAFYITGSNHGRFYVLNILLQVERTIILAVINTLLYNPGNMIS